MSDLFGAKASMNAGITGVLVEGDARLARYSQHEAAMPVGLQDPPVGMLVDEALQLGDERVTCTGGGCGPWAPWEVIL